MNQLAVLYQSEGRYAEAEPLYLRALEAFERVRGREHPSTLGLVNNLAELYQSQGRYAEAEPLYLRALEAFERVRGRDHPNTLTLVNNLAELYQSQGRYAEAEPLYLRALEAFERVLGAEHPNTLTLVNNLAGLYELRGRYAAAEPLYVRAMEARERLLGREHPDTLISVNNLAALYDHQGRYAEAEPLYLRALEAFERVLGRDHPSTLISVNNLAELYQSQGRYAEAELLYVRALGAKERVLGREHPDTLSSVNNLAELYRAQGRYAEAEPLYIRALEAKERVLGREHPSTLSSVNNLATLYRLQGRYAEAEPLYVRALEANERILGREHPSTLNSVNNLAALYDYQGRYAEAEPLYVRALEARERLLGRDHPDTLSSVNNLASMYEDQGRYADAERLYVRALEASERLLGREHPDTLISVNNLATLYDHQGRYAEAEPLLVRVMEARELLLGREHPDTIDAAANLAILRLSSPGSSASAIGPSRFVVSSLRARRAAAVDTAVARAQRGREQLQSGRYFLLFPDAAWAVAQGDAQQRPALTGEAFTALQNGTAGTTDQAVVHMAVRHLADDAAEGLGPLVRERESLNDQWAANSTAFSAALAMPGTEGDAPKAALRAERVRIEARMDEIDARLRREFPQYFALVRPEALDLATTQAMLAPDEAILMVVPTHFGTHVMGLSRTDIQWVHSEWTTTEVDGAVGRLLGNIRVTMAGGRYFYDRQTAFALYQHVVAPMESLLAGKRHVFIVAAGSLTSLPFGILVTGEPEGANDDPQALRTTRWFADTHPLSQIPSIQSLQFLRRYKAGNTASGQTASRFIGFGNPSLEGPTDPAGRQRCSRGRGSADMTPRMIASPSRTRSGATLADVAAIRHLCPLPETATELENMRVAFEAQTTALFTAANATEPRVRQMDLSHVRILAFATHGLLAGDLGNGVEPGLVFTPPHVASEDNDGYLSASEVSALRLDADWVILSACNTAASSGAQGAPGLSGLARAFFYAGARNLLASHWQVADDAAPRLTVRTIELMRENPTLSRAEALQRSMREVRDDRDPLHSAWAHPGVWGVYSLVGDGAR